MTTSVLGATLEALADGGWEGVNVEAIAERAGVHKTTVYRRWPTRGALVAAALVATPFRTPGAITPDTGSLRGDLRVFTDEVEAGLREPRTRKIARALAAASASEPELAAAEAEFWRTRVELARAVFDRAAERGEVPSRTDTNLVATMFVATIKFHIIDRDLDPPPSWYASLVRAVTIAAGAHD